MLPQLVSPCSESMAVVLPNGDEYFCLVNTPVCTSFPLWAAHLFRGHFNSLKLDCKLNCHNTVDISIISWFSVDTWILFCFHTARLKNNKLNLGLLSHLQVRLMLKIRAWIIANLSYFGNFTSVPIVLLCFYVLKYCPFCPLGKKVYWYTSFITH